MLPPNLSKWKINQETENILFFAQLIEELLFNFSLEHFKVPALNTHTLSAELLWLFEQVESGGLEAEHLIPVVNELKVKAERDPVLEILLAEQKGALLRDLDHAQADILNKAAKTIHNILHKEYLSATIAQLRREMINGDKTTLVSLTKNFLTELIYRGYSPEYIFFENKNHFFEGSMPKIIKDISAFDSFVELFSLQTKMWTVVFRTGKDFKHIPQFPSHLGVTADTEKPDLNFSSKLENIGIFLDRKFKLPHYLTFRGITALDSFSARYAMEEKLLILDSLGKYHNHRADLEWSRAALVFDEDRSNAGIFGKPASAILKRPDQSARQFSTILDETAAAVFNEKLDKDSSQRLFRALQIHELAIRAPAPENQLRELWSVVELLFVPKTEEAEKISRLTNRLIPYLTTGFPAKLAADLIKSIRNSGSKGALDILYSVEQGQNLIEKCLLLVFTRENRENLEKIRQCLGNHLLLIQRIDYLAQAFHSASSIRASLDAYADEIGWQIQRAYRTIRLCSHTDQNISVINKLVENIHSIADRAMNVLLNEIGRKKESTSIEQIHEEIFLQSQRHFEILDQRKTETCNRKNFNCLLFGDET